MDDDLTKNENRAHIVKGARYNPMTPMTADGGPVVSPGEMPSGILNGNSVPMTLDPHARARHSNENLTVKPGEVSRTARTTEVRRRLEDRTPKYKY